MEDLEERKSSELYLPNNSSGLKYNAKFPGIQPSNYPPLSIALSTRLLIYAMSLKALVHCLHYEIVQNALCRSQTMKSQVSCYNELKLIKSEINDQTGRWMIITSAQA